MNRATLRDALLSMFAGAAAPWLLVVALGALHAVIHRPRDRINAFLNPGYSRFPRAHLATLAQDLAVGTALGLVLALLVAWLTQTRYWKLWFAFAAAFATSLFVYAGLEGHALRLLFPFRQPATLGVLLGAWAGFWLGARSTSTRSAN